MKKIVLTLFILTLWSCSNEEENLIPKEDYATFLNDHIPSFKGKLNTQAFYWKYGQYTGQIATGYENGNGICDPSDPVRILSFGLSVENEANQLIFITPKMNINNQSEVNTILSKGKKNIGTLYNDFQIIIRKNDVIYTSNPISNQQFEILKTEDFINDFNKKRKLVWIKIDHLELTNCNTCGDKLQVTEGFIIAELEGYQME